MTSSKKNSNQLTNQVIHGDCLEVIQKIKPESVDLVYVDPPFFTQKKHTLRRSSDNKKFSFNDYWEDKKQYADFLRERLLELRKVLKDTGSIFFHCDSDANFIVRELLNEVFGSGNFVSEIIWTYKRWSNSSKSLLPAHQTIFFYSKSKNFKFNQKFVDYSVTTNVDQILQKRERNENGKSVYKKNSDGSIAHQEVKNGVPLSDVWEIPFLNPKAKERVGYPTQKPILLLERIIELVTDEGDLVLDPFSGSGTTAVAAMLLRRNFLAIDQSIDAVSLCEERIKNPIKTESAVISHGRSSFLDNTELVKSIFGNIDLKVVHRNGGYDCLYNHKVLGLIPIKIQAERETLAQAIKSLVKSTAGKEFKKMFVIQRFPSDAEFEFDSKITSNILIVKHPALILVE